MTIRRAVPLQGEAQDPGAALAPGAGRRAKASGASAAPTPAAAPEVPAAPDPAPAPAPPEGGSAEAASSEREEQASSEREEQASSEREEQASAASSSTTGSATPDPVPAPAPDASAAVPATAGADPGADTLLVASASGGGPGPTADAEAHGGPKKPMLAAAAIVGAILIGVPFLVAGQGDKDERVSDRTDNAAGTVLDTDRIPQAPESYATESPSPSASASPSPSKSPEEKRTKDTVDAPVVKRDQPSPTPSASKKTEKKTTTLSAAEKLRQEANAASSASNILLKNSTTGQCADVPNYGNGKIDGPVNQYPCNGTTNDNQLWNLEVTEAKGGPNGSSLFLIRNSKDKFCMDLPYYGAAAMGTNITEYYCRATSDNQLWWLDPRSDGSYWIRSYSSSNLCLGLEGGGSAGNDAHLEIGGCGPADRWIL
ncbi:RICIN domain-containing protein [Streptomyces sp. NPDC090106]|uniref:RICIN domain-containing protein n=1 Tax=Streptomyces sp. NPDC090106 TaxID=3365946 RepID=UPI003817C9FF